MIGQRDNPDFVQSEEDCARNLELCQDADDTTIRESVQLA
jgi:hypothetical protein